MTTQMVRKQIYIQKRQEVLLKRLAEMRGVSEAEIIRRAIEREFSGETVPPLPDPMAAFQEFKKAALAQRNKKTPGDAYQWNREDLYVEREGRWLRDAGEKPEE